MITVFIVLTVLVVIIDISIVKAGTLADKRMEEIMRNEQRSKECKNEGAEAESI